MPPDLRQFAPSALRNREPILHALRPYLPPTGLVLEVASGTGEHVAFLAAALPHLAWQPTDLDPERRASIDAWVHEAGLSNVHPALPLDAMGDAWPVARAAAVLCINMIHIAPPEATAGLIAGAGRVLAPGGLLAIYGPVRRGGWPLEPGNAAFDADLRARDPSWGLRLLDTSRRWLGGQDFTRRSWSVCRPVIAWCCSGASRLRKTSAEDRSGLRPELRQRTAVLWTPESRGKGDDYPLSGAG